MGPLLAKWATKGSLWLKIHGFMHEEAQMGPFGCLRVKVWISKAFWAYAFVDYFHVCFLKLRYLNEVGGIGVQIVTGLADPSANIIFGAVVDERYTGEVHVTIIATGFSQTLQKSLVYPKSEVLSRGVEVVRKEPSSPPPSRFRQGIGSKGFL